MPGAIAEEASRFSPSPSLKVCEHTLVASTRQSGRALRALTARTSHVHDTRTPRTREGMIDPGRMFEGCCWCKLL